MIATFILLLELYCIIVVGVAADRARRFITAVIPSRHHYRAGQEIVLVLGSCPEARLLFNLSRPTVVASKSKSWKANRQCQLRANRYTQRERVVVPGAV